ncbi:glycyl-radical enzyme activating protein [Anaerovorax sp. IOR16]|uniref:glycyl-radical enzyme activating protein n=1 Tax=Anaerovorax sp. IOR16 TaxID=2773458 RepID=UPI0019CFF886|nr:glycyl-radical enzyme activating protein [Anaerovorax sp. IOR16]
MSNTPESVLVGSLQKFSVEDGPGIRTTVFMKGCPLSCKWCHNPELIDPQQQLIKSPNNCIGCGYCVKICPQGAVTMNLEEGVVIDRSKCDVCLKCEDECYAQALRPVAKPMTIDEILCIAEQDKGFYDNTEGGITVSGGEILMHAEFVSKLIDEAGKRGINVCMDTSGFGDSQALMKMALMENVTDILYDMKSIDDEVHREYTGVSNQLIIGNLRRLAANARTVDKLIMRMPLIKGVNDSDDIIKRTGELYREIGVKRVNLLPYHSLGISKKRNVGGTQEEFEQPTEERLTEIEFYFKNEINLKVEILGRV